MPLLNVRRVYVVQDRESGAFVDCNMTLVRSLRYAARVESEQLVRESMAFSLHDGQLICPDGFDIVQLYEIDN